MMRVLLPQAPAALHLLLPRVPATLHVLLPHTPTALRLLPQALTALHLLLSHAPTAVPALLLQQEQLEAKEELLGLMSRNGRTSKNNNNNKFSLYSASHLSRQISKGFTINKKLYVVIKLILKKLIK